MVSAKPRRTAGSRDLAKHTAVRNIHRLVELTFSYQQGVVDEPHDLGLGHLFDRIEDEHDVVAEGVQIFLAEFGDDLFENSPAAAGKGEIPLALHVIQGNNRLVESLVADRLHIICQLNRPFQAPDQLCSTAGYPAAGA